MMQEIIYEQKSDNSEYIYFRYVDPKLPARSPGIRGLHFHNAIEIKVVAKGKIRAFSNGEEYLLEEGDIFFVPSLSPHYYDNNKGGSCYYDLVFDENFFKKICVGDYVLPSHMKKNDAWELLETILKNTWKAEWSEFNSQRRRSFIFSFLGTLLQYYAPIKVEKTINVVLLRAMKFVEDNYTQDITIESLAKLFGYSKAHFSYIFHKFTGMNFKDYLNRIRISAAIKLQNEQPNLPRYVIAEKVGFASWSTYTRAYHKFGDSLE